MRIVYDASARISSGSVSLNDCLYAGPSLLNELSGIILRFRVFAQAFTADVEKAFLQIELNEEDRDATRFLWLKDIRQSVDDYQNLEMYRFCRVLFGTAPFLLGATIQHHLNSHGEDWVAKDLKETIYMDNVSSVSNDTKAMEYYPRSRYLMQTAGMNLRQCTTNTKPLKRKIEQDKTGVASIVKVLGLIWNSETDTLSLSLKKYSRRGEGSKDNNEKICAQHSSQDIRPNGVRKSPLLSKRR